MKKILIVLALLPSIAFAYSSPGQPGGFVNDFAQMMTAESRAQLESELAFFNQETTTEVAVVTIPSLEGDTIENYAVKLFEEWKIGKEKQDNGVLLLIARDDRELRIEVGYGLEGALTDLESKQIIEKAITPWFKESNFDQGILKGVLAIEEAVRGEYVAPEVQEEPNWSSDWPTLVIIGIWFLFHMLMGILGSTKSWWLGGVLGGVVGTIIGIVQASLMVGVIFALFLVPFGLLIDYLVSKKMSSRRGSRGPWFGGGVGGGGGFGGGGFGGFGGGGSGGGGASGRW